MKLNFLICFSCRGLCDGKLSLSVSHTYHRELDVLDLITEIKASFSGATRQRQLHSFSSSKPSHKILCVRAEINLSFIVSCIFYVEHAAKTPIKC